MKRLREEEERIAQERRQAELEELRRQREVSDEITRKQREKEKEVEEKLRRREEEREREAREKEVFIRFYFLLSVIHRCCNCCREQREPLRLASESVLRNPAGVGARPNQNSHQVMAQSPTARRKTPNGAIPAATSTRALRARSPSVVT